MRKTILLYIFSIISLSKMYAQDIDKPNVIIFYVDDLGWQDTNLNNLENPVPWETPKMEALAADGAKFSQAYSPAPTCAPSRAAMLSGRHPIKTKVTQVSGGFLPALKKAKAANKLIGPFFPHRLDVSEYTIAEALSANGYHTGHVGKWHIDGDNGFPIATDQGFDTKFTDRGVQQGMKDRYDTSEFGGNDSDYPLDADGVPYDSVTDEAVAYLEDRVTASEPFFLYMATWLVHTPIQTRDLPMLQAVTAKLVASGQINEADLSEDGIPTETTPLTADGEYNPFYGAMVQTVDWSLGKIVDYLKATNDPRNPGKTLFETTYVIFSSDNGASEQNNADNGFEIVADNYPLDEGKTSSREGGIRVPLVVTGPGISTAEYSNVVNGLDFYPTILSLTGTTISTELSNDLDGADLSPLLKGTKNIVEQTTEGVTSERTDLFWHYPNADDDKSKSSIRRGNYKLYKHYIDGTYHAFQLYNGGDVIVDINEQADVIDSMDQTLKQDMIDTLEAYLTDNDARLPTWNPDYAEDDAPLANQTIVPSVDTVVYNQASGTATATIEGDLSKAAISSGYLLYTEVEYKNDKEEWLEAGIVTINGNIITANVPSNAHKIAFNLRDENNFLVLSDELEIVNIAQITLNVTEEEQRFSANSIDVYSELVGNTSVSNAVFLQMRTDGGGDGVNFNVATTETITCSKVSFRVRSQDGDTANFKVTFGGNSKTKEYVSTKSGDELNFEFDTPTILTDVAQSMEFILTGLTNSDDKTPRFRIYDIKFHLDLTSLGFEDVKDNNEALMIYPNPVKNIFNLNKDVNSGVLYDLLGAKKFEFNKDNTSKDISKLKSGVYLLQVKLENGTQKSLKLLKD